MKVRPQTFWEHKYEEDLRQNLREQFLLIMLHLLYPKKQYFEVVEMFLDDCNGRKL